MAEILEETQDANLQEGGYSEAAKVTLNGAVSTRIKRMRGWLGVKALRLLVVMMMMAVALLTVMDIRDGTDKCKNEKVSR